MTGISTKDKLVGFGYGRVSTEEQKEKGLSPEDQEERIRTFGDQWDIELVNVIIESTSGSIPIAKRDGMKRITQAMRRKEINTIVILRPDRLSRDTPDAITTGRAWAKNNIYFFMTEFGPNPVDLSTPEGEFVFTQWYALANYGRRRIAKNTSAALQYRKKHRLTYCRFAPYGWQKETKPTARNKQGKPVKRLIAVPEEQEVIQQIQVWRSEEKPVPYWKIAERLNSRRIATKNGGKQWYASTVKYVLDRSIIG